jgi:hypothetical protein
MSQFSRNEGPKWEFHKFIEDEATAPGVPKIVARISVLQVQFPKYSFELGVWRGQLFNRNFRADDDISLLAKIASDAQAYVRQQNEASAELERQAHAKRVQEQREFEARKAQKKVNHSKNLERRRDEDRRRTQNAKSGNR